MIRINQLKLLVTENEEHLPKAAAKALGISVHEIKDLHIIRKSVDARRKDKLAYSYVIDVELTKETQTRLLKKKNKNFQLAEKVQYCFPASGSTPLTQPPVIIGSGPAGLFCGLMLAEQGYRPIIVERGECVEKRLQTVEGFWQGEKLNPQSNVQFGEGGAGTFSDGKLNTMVKDKFGRNRKVLEILANHGAGKAILYQGKPHIGTDVLTQVVKSIRNRIISLGGQVLFDTQVTDFAVQDGRLAGVVLNGEKLLPCRVVVLAVGHSARDTFEMLRSHPVEMRAKAFAVGVRIIHPQEMINKAQYGETGARLLPAADYKLTMQTASGRGVYSFCMCPGGYVVNASSEAGRLAVNGMSYQKRDSLCANSALIVTVNPDDFGGSDVLAGVAFQRCLEEGAYQAGKGKIPVQLYRDFAANVKSDCYGDVPPTIKGETSFSNLKEFLPEFISSSLIEGIDYFEKKIPGFSRGDSILAGVESRTSSPVRIERDDSFESSLKGLYPCGEGAGYAGGIMSAAMDGLKVAEAIAGRFHY